MPEEVASMPELLVDQPVAYGDAPRGQGGLTRTGNLPRAKSPSTRTSLPMLDCRVLYQLWDLGSTRSQDFLDGSSEEPWTPGRSPQFVPDPTMVESIGPKAGGASRRL